jgi:hypothetical protein
VPALQSSAQQVDNGGGSAADAARVLIMTMVVLIAWDMAEGRHHSNARGARQKQSNAVWIPWLATH